MKVKQFILNSNGVLKPVFTTIRQGNSHRAIRSRTKAFRRLDPDLPVFCCCCDPAVPMFLVNGPYGPHLRNQRGCGPEHRTTCPKYNDARRAHPAEIPADGENPPPHDNEAIVLRNSTFIEPRARNLGMHDPRTRKKRGQRPSWLSPSRKSPLGLYVRLMHEAKTNVFRPWTATVSFAAFVDSLAKQLEPLSVNGRPAIDRVFIAGTGDLFSLDAVMRRYRDDEGGDALALVLGVVDRYLVNGDSVALFMTGVAQPIYLNKAAWFRAVKNGWYSNMANALAASEAGRMKVHCALSVRWNGERLVGKAPSLMATTNHWIPVLSEIELDEVNRAIEKERYFIKPIYNWKTDRFCHDLILLDTLFPFRMELCGWTGDDYFARKEFVRERSAKDYPEGSYAFFYPGDPPIDYPEVAPKDKWHDYQEAHGDL